MIIFSMCFVAVSEVNALELCGEPKQGELLVVKDPDAIEIIIENNLGEKKYPVSEDGSVLIALHRDAPSVLHIEATLQTEGKKFFDLKVAKTQWDVQRIEGVKKHHVMPSRVHEKEILREQKDVSKSLSIKNMRQYWQNGFVMPLEGRVSGYFGNQRIFNGVPKSPHSGTDIAAPEGTPVKASGSGVVVLSGQNYFYTGNMVIIDHGQGLQTIYAHLKDAVVHEKDKVVKGQIIGHVGKTGRATGPHLHWGASLNNVRFNPYSLLNIKDKVCRKPDGYYMGDRAENE